MFFYMAILFGTTFVIGICVYMACSRNFIKTIFIKSFLTFYKVELPLIPQFYSVFNNY